MHSHSGLPLLHAARAPDIRRVRRLRRGSTSRATLVALVFVGGVVAALNYGRAERAAANVNPYTPVTAGSLPADQRPMAGDALGAFTVTNLEGRVIPLVTPGTPAIIMVSSVTCGWCKRALSDFAEMAQGRPVPRLKLLTLEGAAEGTPMLNRARLHGAELVGPVGSADQVLLTFRYPGTPTFLAIDRNGRVVRTMPGYPSREELTKWFKVMVGDAEEP